MANNLNNPIDHQGEIDPGMLLLKISDIFGRNWILIISILITGLVSALVNHKLKRPKYQSSMVIESRILNYSNAQNLIQTLNKLIQDGNHEMLASKLGLELKPAAILAGIEAQDIGEIIGPEEERKSSTLKIDVKVYDNAILPGLENALINYLENNPYVKKRVEIEKENLAALSTRISHEIEQLKQLKRTLNQEIVTKGSSNNITVIDPANVYKELILLYETELDTRAQLELIDNIQVIEGFTPFKGQAGPTPVISGLIGLGIALLTSILVLIILELRRYMRGIKQNKHQQASGFY